ncbi:unnamed protein product [Brachionus calyciflorus]|uniref:Uncharacterized protein n=1 Tax=Brachionus calyciflorus TaxID=104777 RepID=A0A813XP61_9BILA|nr:unnamed protein product [Brachionus calyciflorus]
MDFCDLNENVIFVAESINSAQRLIFNNLKTLTPENSEYDKVKNLISLSIQICVNSSLDEGFFVERKIKFDIFNFLLKKMANLATVVPVSDLSFDLVMDLIIENQYEDFQEFLSCLEREKVEELQFKLIDYLNKRSKKLNFDTKCIYFCTDCCLSNINRSEKLKFFELIELNLTNYKGISTYYLNKILENVIDNFDQDKQLEKLEDTVKILKILTLNFTHIPETVQLNCLNLLVDFLAFLKHEQLYSALKKIQIDSFLEYMCVLLDREYGIIFDESFIIRHKLNGYEDFLNDYLNRLFDDNVKTTTQRDLETLKCVRIKLINLKCVYSLLKIVDIMHRNGDTSENEFKDFFWELFDNLDLEIQIDLIFKIYKDREITLTEKASVLCLDETNFNHELTLVLNQLSLNSGDDEKYLRKITRLLCKSAKIIIERLIFNILSNKSQVQSFSKIIFKFSKLFKIDTPKTIKFNILIDCLELNLASILESKNEKMFQNYVQFIKIILKQTESVDIEPNDFYNQIILKYFKMEKIELNSLLYVLEIYDLFLKHININLTQLVFLLELIDVLTIEVLDNDQEEALILKVKEKCISISKHLVKILEKKDSLEIESFKVYSKKYYWPISIVLAPLTKQIVIPECLCEIIKETNYNIILLNTENSEFECILEAICLTNLSRTFKVDLSECDNETLINGLTRVISLKKSNIELKNIFEFLYQNFINKKIKFINADDDEESYKEDSIYNQFLKLFVYVFIILFENNFKLDYVLLNFIQYIKELINQTNEYDIKKQIILETICNILKLGLILNESNSKDLLAFVVELSNSYVNTIQTNEQQKTNQNEAITSEFQNCLVLIEKYDETKFKNFKYLIKQNIQKIS